MGSPKRAANQCLAPPAYHVDWDSPSAETGTVKRRPNSCGDAVKLVEFSTENTHARKCSLDSPSLSDGLNKKKLNPPLFCKDISEEEHKFLIDKMGKVKPESATLFPAESVPTNDAPKSRISKLKAPTSYAAKDNKKVEEELKQNTPKKTISKFKLTFAQKARSEKPSKFKMFSPNLKTAERSVANEYVQFDFQCGKSKTFGPKWSKVPSKIPITPVESDETKVLHLSPNKKYTVTSKYGIRCDKDNYVVFDPQGGFVPKSKKRTSFCAESDTDSGILSPASPLYSDLDKRKSMLTSTEEDDDPDGEDLLRRVCQQEKVCFLRLNFLFASVLGVIYLKESILYVCSLVVSEI